MNAIQLYEMLIFFLITTTYFVVEVKNLRHPSLRRGRKQASEAGLVTIATEEGDPRASCLWDAIRLLGTGCIVIMCGHTDIKVVQKSQTNEKST